MTEAKKPFVVQTAVHARFLLAKAEARLVAQLAAAEETKVQISEYQNLAATLPEGSPAAVSVQVPVGSVVDFAFGREDKRVTLQGVVEAVKLNDKGQVAQYKVKVGSGFDADYKTVFPGSITNVVSSPVAEAAAEVPAETVENDDPLAS